MELSKDQVQTMLQPASQKNEIGIIAFSASEKFSNHLLFIASERGCMILFVNSLDGIKQRSSPSNTSTAHP